MVVVLVVLYIAVIVLIIASMWIIFEKAGEPGWASIIPIYNGIVFLKIVGKPLWWILLFFIPIVSLVIVILLYICLLYTSPSPRDRTRSRMPSSA